MNFKDEFFKKMQLLLKDDYEKFLKSYDNDNFRGIRVNTLKCSDDKLNQLIGVLEKTPFSEHGYYLDKDYSGIGKNPLHHAGAFYVQEPSAMSAATVLDVKPGDKVLDLCAAPGGKTTQLAAMLGGEGVIVANEYVSSRAQILLSNVERMGIKNALVVNNRPDILCDKLGGYFDKVLVDAPCSGEGMFRKEPKALGEWSEQAVLDCAKRQALILDSAKKAVKYGGELVYSTCTFSEEENERQIDRFLNENNDFELVDCGVDFGSCIPNGQLEGVSIDTQKVRRVFPFDGGEGHFVAKLRKIGQTDDWTTEYKYIYEENKLFSEFYKQNFNDKIPERVYTVGDQVYILPNTMPEIKGLHLLRSGVLAGKIVKNRFVPSHCLYMSSGYNQLINKINFSLDDKLLLDFLHGIEIPCDSGYTGYTGVFVEGISIGFGKASNGSLKNHYPKGLRLL